jgi:signal transduction histidine kinase
MGKSFIMNKLIDKLILFIICIALLAQNQSDIYIVVPVISVIAASALLNFVDSAFSIAIFAAWCGVCILSPIFAFFLPLVCYDLFRSRWRWALFLATIPLSIAYTQFPLDQCIFIALFMTLAYLLRRHTEVLTHTKAEYLALRDSAKEFSMQLESKNKELLDKQDYEIHLATLNERNRIARDIHDNVGHILSNALLQTGALMATCTDDAIKPRLQTLRDTLSSGMDSIRCSVHNLHDESIDLFAEAQSLAEGFNFCEISLDYDVDSSPPQLVKYALLAVVKETLSNVIRHSNATRVNVTLREHPAFYQLVVRDNGTKTSPSGEGGIGLKNITQRVTSLGGQVNISAESGFTVFVSIPKEKAL